MQLTKFNEVATMSSKEIAALTGKRHDNILADVEKLVSFYTEKYSTEKAGELVESGTYKDSTGRSNRCFHLSKDAALDLVTGYSIEHRHAVNQRWMELESQQTKVMTPAQVLLQQVQMMVALEAEQAKTNERVARIEAKQQAFEEGSSYFTVIGYAVWKNLPPLDLKSASAIGKFAAKISKSEGILIDRVKDPRFGIVNAYHESVMEKAVSKFME